MTQKTWRDMNSNRMEAMMELARQTKAIIETKETQVGIKIRDGALCMSLL